ncbi:MAG: amidohydrolase [Fidelibacterota bacterium]|nr:MAG: amidohydrolase [Candidatus Neomarinimicrobiota bacterium]
MMRITGLLAISSGLVLLLSCTPRSGVDMILTGGTILSMDKYLAPAEAMAIVDGRILAVGTKEEILTLGTWRTKRINLRGAVVVPGLTDSHFHFRSFGRSLEELQLVGTRSAAEIVSLVADRAQKLPAGTWIRGRGWDQNDWELKTFPTSTVLDQATSNHPVMLTRVDGHAIWVNSRAMNLAGVTSSTLTPEGGAILRDKHHNPTGVFVDNAADLIRKVIPSPSKEDTRRWLLAAAQRCLEVGLTEIHDAGANATTLEVLKELIDKEQFAMRYYGMLDGDDEQLLETYFQRGPVINYGGRMTVRSVKLYADGALGSRGAALLQPYSDDPENRGLLVTSQEELESTVTRIFQAGFQPCIHAIGDRANRMVLDVYERALAPFAEADLRPRIEHAQVLARTDIRRFARLGVLPAMQPSHATSDMYWAEDRLGAERVRGAYAWRQLLNTGAIIPGGSDCPVEREEPLLQLYAARTRQDISGWPEGGWFPEERMGGLEALKSLTTWAAYAAFEESTRGKILPGFDADLTVISVNPVTCEPHLLPEAKILMTIVAGQVIWHDKKGFRDLEHGHPPGSTTSTPPGGSSDE